MPLDRPARCNNTESWFEAGAPLSRRTLIKTAPALGGGLLLSVIVPGLGDMSAAGSTEDFAPNAYVRIGRSGRVTLIIPQVEMGQGTYTSLPMLLAEELEVDLDQVDVEHAPPNEKLYRNPLLGLQATGGSTSIRGFWEPLSRAGATARSMLLAAAAATWQVQPVLCRAVRGEVVYIPTGRRLPYRQLADKAATLPVPDNVTLKEPKDFRLVGTSAKRLDSPDKVNGKAVFGIDIRIPGMKFATVAACPVLGGKLVRVDDMRARAIKGVRQVVRLDNAVAVIADHMGAAQKGLAALDIIWDFGPNAQLSTTDLVRQLEEASKTPGLIARQEGDVSQAMAGAVRKVEAEYQIPMLAHATMEPMNCTAHVRADSCDVWVGTQVLSRAQAAAAQAAGLPSERVKVHNCLLGGGFGRRLEVDGITQAVEIARQVDAPVKVVWTREEDIQHDVYRPYYYDRLAAGLDETGMPVAWTHRICGPSIIARWSPPSSILARWLSVFRSRLDLDAVSSAAGPYAFPNVLIDYVRQDPPPGIVTGWWRGVGVAHNAFMVEGFIDELATLANKDPVDYRRALLGSAPRARSVLDLAATKADWDHPMAPGRGRGVSVIFGFGSYLAQVAEVAVGKDGRVRVERIICAVDCGRIVNPNIVVAQIEGGTIFGMTAALYGEITIKDGRVEQSNFDTYKSVRIDEAPKLEVHLVESTEAPGGIGELATAATAPALVNAIFAATGKRLRNLPVNVGQLKT
jgi:isoquinoline 1-oxidoreductase subunit beta